MAVFEKYGDFFEMYVDADGGLHFPPPTEAAPKGRSFVNADGGVQIPPPSEEATRNLQTGQRPSQQLHLEQDSPSEDSQCDDHDEWGEFDRMMAQLGFERPESP